MPKSLRDMVRHFIEQDGDSTTPHIHLSPPPFIQSIFKKSLPKPEQIYDPLSVMIAQKHFRERSPGNQNGSYLINQNADITLFGRRVKKTTFPKGSFFEVKVSEDSDGRLWALKRATLLIDNILNLARYNMSPLPLMHLLGYLEIPFVWEVEVAVAKIFTFTQYEDKKQAAIDFLKYIPLKKIQDFFNNPVTPPRPKYDATLVSELINLKREYIALKRLNRLHSASLYRGKKGQYKFVIETPLIEGFDFFDVMNSNIFGIGELPWHKIKALVLKIIKAYENWTINGILNHGDLKIENLMIFRGLDGELDCQWIDGNFSYTEEDLMAGIIPLYKRIGSYSYMAPELLENKSRALLSPDDIKAYLQAVDVFALGTLLMMFMSQYYPGEAQHSYDKIKMRENYHKNFQLILETEPVDSPKKETYRLFAKMLDGDPQKRPTIRQISEFFEKDVPVVADSVAKCKI